MPRDPLIGIVGKPSSGKSTTLNSLTDAGAAVGAFPFTTIEPNQATGYLQVECACSRFGKEDLCKPNYGWCSKGKGISPSNCWMWQGLCLERIPAEGLEINSWMI